MKLRVLLSATALSSATLFVPGVAFAAEPAPTAAATLQAAAPAAAEDDKKDEAIVVTGTRIRRPNIEASVPITSISGEELFQQGQNNLGDTLNDLPQLRSTFAQQNPGSGIGIAGLSLLDLRGLGTIRTLVLVNGRRHVPADILNNASSVDINTISNDLVERIDVVTGGSSAVYGSDAVAGVVNFVLRKSYDGLQVRGSTGISQPGFGANYFASAMAGKNFADGRGNITVQGEYAHQNRVYGSDIPSYRQVDGFATVDADVGGLPLGSDGFPDAVFFRDVRSSTTSMYGLAVVPQPAVGGLCGTGTLANNGPANTSGTPFNCNYLFQANGALTPQTGTRFGLGPAGTYVGGNGITGREGQILSVIPKMDRVNLNLLAHFEVSPALDLFFEGKYVRIKTVGNNAGPTFVNNTTASLGNDARIDPRLDNPFLALADPNARATIGNAYLAANCGYTLGSSLAAATCVQGNAAAQAARTAAIADGSYRFLFARLFTDIGNRDEYFTRETYRFVAGARGTFNDDWSYEISGNYGKFNETDDIRGFVDRQRFVLSLDAGRNPITGAIQCRSQFDAASAVGNSALAGGNSTAAQLATKLAADIAACKPYNLFGSDPTNTNQAAAAYFGANIINKSSIEQIDINGFVSGDSSQLFSLPGGPVKFVLGGEYRREKAINDSDSAADTLYTNGVFLGDVNAPAQIVKEAFGELDIPLLKDVPFFDSLTANFAGRVSDYNTGAGTTYTYNAGFEWAPIRDIRFRGNYGRAVRAPNVSESGFPAVPNFANGFIDPCNANAIGNGTAARVTNCQNTLTTAQLANLQPAGYSLGVISGSNANLKAEKSDSYTYGVVLQPRFIPGFSLTVDYYNIRVNNVIVSLAAQTIINSCYDSPGLSSPLCAGFARNLGTTNGSNGELPGQVLTNSIVQGPANFASRVRKGIDTEATYRRTFSENVKFNSRLIYTHVFKSSNYENPSIPNTENILLNELGDPKDEFRFDADLTVNHVTFGYGAHYIGPMLTSTFENFFPNNAGVTGQTGLPLNYDAIEIQSYPSVLYHDLRVSFDIGDKSKGKRALNFYVGVDNVTNVLPPLGSTATGAGSAIYSFRGRSFYAGFKAQF